MTHTPTTQREADERAEACMQIAHRWAQAAYCKALNMPGEDIDSIKRELRAAIDQDTRQAAPEALALTEAETRLMARLRAASGSGATPWVDLLTEIDDPHMVDFDELTMLAHILERTIRQAAPEAPAAPAVNIGGCPYCGKSGNCTENCSAATDQPSTGQADEYQPGQWWLSALEALWGHGLCDDDTRRAAKVACDFASKVFAARASLTPTAPQAASQQAEPATGDKPAKLPWRITESPRKIVGSDGATVANLTALDLPNAHLIVESVNRAAPQAATTASASTDATLIDEGTMRAIVVKAREFYLGYLSRHIPMDDIDAVRADVTTDTATRAIAFDLRAALARAPLPTQTEMQEPICPACQGGGEGLMMEGAGPDAYEVPCNCRYCNGSGGLLDAYNGLVALLSAEREKYLQLCGKVYFGAQQVQAVDVARDALNEAFTAVSRATETALVRGPYLDARNDALNAIRALQSRTNTTGGSDE